MKFFRDERVGALFMLVAAFIGFAAFNFGDSTSLWQAHVFFWPYVSQIGMAAFFALIGFELRNEFASGLFKNPRAVLVPASAALVGVIVPALAYLAVVSASGGGAELLSGWPMVTATDVSFALMVFSLLAKGLPTQLRAFLLSFAVIDDIFATIALAATFHRVDALTPMIAVGCALTLGFFLRPAAVAKIIGWLSPVVAFGALPVFAFFAMQIHFDAQAISSGTGAILLAAFATRPFAKWLGVFVGAIVSNRALPAAARLSLTATELLRVSSLAGIGFTVSLLAADLAFAGDEQLFAASATLTVIASLVAACLSVIALRVRRGVR